jgi:hypothetical protein
MCLLGIVFSLICLCYAGLIDRDGTSAIIEGRENCHYGSFMQKIDHFGRHNGTFSQRYSLNTDYYEPGGPIFWTQGSEGADLDCIVR